MAALDFPASPTVGQTYTANGSTWTWDGVSWLATNPTVSKIVAVTKAILIELRVALMNSPFEVVATLCI